MSLYTIKGILILDSEGKRIASRYYTKDWPTSKEQLAFEKTLFSKTFRANTEVILIENLVAVYRSSADVCIYVMSSFDENELLLWNTLSCLYDTFSLLLNQIDKRTLLENLDYVILCIDELVDDGIILESEAAVIAQRVAMKGSDSELALTDQSLASALQQARDQFTRSFLKG
eukprot:TRINITY_DN3252_c1_g1_i1.p1 TRINITY_DN3252_c1_g1~~TRINITY_DN3252_c1_g1_i1.p1  ORF type:complete len:173 (+),score=84.95 TRINITY_DN3252_c1_g1_i1:94-612(+)